MEKKEKFIIILITIVILIGIFVAFLVSNSQKTPPEVIVQNENRVTSEAIIGGYTWKVFGSNIIADSIDLKTIDYSSKNTVVSRTGELLTLSTTEKFSINQINYFDINSSEIIDARVKSDEASTYFSLNAPEIEGTYLCLFKLDYFSKGTAEYAVKVVVTDENIYDVKEVIKYKNTNISNIVSVKDIINKLPYANELNGITINTVDTPKSINIKYNNINADKDDLLNSSIALFALIPDLDFIGYETKELDKDIYYSRDEVNNLVSRNVIEYADNSELWLREVIYKEDKFKANNDIEIYTSVISSSLAKVSEKEIGKYVAINLNEDSFSGEILLNEYNKKELLSNLNSEYESVMLVNKDEFNNEEGTLVDVSLDKKLDETTYVINVKLETERKEEYSYNFKVVRDINLNQIELYDKESGDKE